MIIALAVTPEGYPLAFEVLPGNTSDKTTLKQFGCRSYSVDPERHLDRVYEGFLPNRLGTSRNR